MKIRVLLFPYRLVDQHFVLYETKLCWGKEGTIKFMNKVNSIIIFIHETKQKTDITFFTKDFCLNLDDLTTTFSSLGTHLLLRPYPPSFPLPGH